MTVFLHSRRRSWRALMLALLVTYTAAGTEDGALLPSIAARSYYRELPRPPGVPSDAELERAGTLTGEVSIDPQEIFDTEQPEENTALFRMGNRLHIRTRHGTIEQQLLFSPGERYSGRLLAESERLLRDTRYLHDAYIRPVAFHDGVVDIEVVTRDVWTLNPGISFGRSGGENSSGIELEELNLLGHGSQLQLAVKSTVDRDTRSIEYRDQHFNSSWWDLLLRYSDNSDGEARELGIDHPFYALDTRWSAGASALTEDRIDSRYDLGEVWDQYEVRQQAMQIHAGWSPGIDNGWTTRYTTGFTLDDSRFFDVAGDTPTRVLPSDRKLAYPWIAWERVQENYRKDHNRDQIQRTEDLALGWRARASLGYASPDVGADRTAWMMTLDGSKGYALSARQTLLLSIESSGRWEAGDWADGLLSERVRYYFRQSPRRLLYMSLGSDLSINPDADHQLLLGGENGLRGYPLRYQGGEGRWLFTIEQRFFTSWYPFRLFNVGGAVFGDMGSTWGDNPFGMPSQGVLKDVGFGLRLGNSRSALGNVLHLDVAFPLDGGSDIRQVQFLVETKKSF